MAIIGEIFGFLDSDGFADGEAGGAEGRREIIRNTNRLVSRGGHLYHYLGNADKSANVNNYPTLGVIDINKNTSNIGFGSDFWTMTQPSVPIRKKPGIRRARVKVRYFVSGHETMYLYIGTLEAPWNPNTRTDHPNCLTLTGNGTQNWQVVTKDNLFINALEYDIFTFHMRGGLTSNPMSSQYGAQTGQFLCHKGSNFISADHYTSSPPYYPGWQDFTASGSAPGEAPSWGVEKGHYVKLQDSNGIDLPGNYTIIKPWNIASLLVYPQLTFNIGDASVGDPVNTGTFNIYDLAIWRICSLAIYGMDMETETL